MVEDISEQVKQIVADYDHVAPQATADRLRGLWLQFEPKSVAGIKAELREQQETIGIPVPVLKAIGKEVSKPARKHTDRFVPLARLLWDRYGREGRALASLMLGAMELAAPHAIVPLLIDLCRTCVTWEDADRLAMDALEPIVRKAPEHWLGAIEPWLADESKWVRRAGATVAGRLPMVHAEYTAQSLNLLQRLLADQETDVKRAVSFGIRISARGDSTAVCDFLARQVPPQDKAATWVLCDAVRSMTREFLPEFVRLLPLYEQWAADPALGGQDRRSVESALKTLQDSAA
jgi:hypothetical protein